jgi:2-polyprenyl-3-methyl-5-hydroxy-6-metoxy-1,4-benzoquinol methylase
MARDAYHQHDRREILPFLPSKVSRLLDVGCGEGAFGELVRTVKAAEVWGVEIEEQCIAEASKRLTRVIRGDAASALTALRGQVFDVITFNDVLEHLPSPRDSLLCAKDLLSADGVIVASLPNIRCYPAMCHILFEKDFKYVEEGVFDSTHLRFFTRKSALRMFASAGLSVLLSQGINGIPPRRRYMPLYWLLKVIAEDMCFLQFVFVARVASGR